MYVLDVFIDLHVNANDTIETKLTKNVKFVINIRDYAALYKILGWLYHKIIAKLIKLRIYL